MADGAGAPRCPGANCAGQLPQPAGCSAGKVALEGQDFLGELPELLAVELHSTLDAVLCNSADSNELRSSAGEPPRTLRFVFQAVRDASGESLKGIAVTIQDLTREVELNAALSRFISNVSHELRTPLFNIKSYVETLHDLGDQLSADYKKSFLASPTTKPIG